LVKKSLIMLSYREELYDEKANFFDILNRALSKNEIKNLLTALAVNFKEKTTITWGKVKQF